MSNIDHVFSNHIDKGHYWQLIAYVLPIRLDHVFSNQNDKGHY